MGKELVLGRVGCIRKWVTEDAHVWTHAHTHRGWVVGELGCMVRAF